MTLYYARFSNAPHGDRHGLWIDPLNPERMIEADDGGATISSDGGKTWTSEDNQPTAQFYHVNVDNAFPYRLYGEQQDNSSISIPSRTDHGYIGREDWYSVGGGESAFAVPDPRDSNVVYATSYHGEVTRFDKRDGQVQQLGLFEDFTDGEGAAKMKHRFQWTTPLALSPQNPDEMYRGAEVLLMSTDKGINWTAISPDLTRDDKSKQVLAGGPITFEDTGAEIYATIFAIAPSPVEKGLIWVGSDDGLVHVTHDDGKNWADVTPKEIPAFSRVSIIEPSPFAADMVYVVYDRHMNDDLRPYIFKSSDFGKTWTKLVNGIPEDTFVHVVREDPKKRGLLYAGTNRGVLVSFDDGQHWQSLKQNLPTASVQDLAVKGDDLVVATFGRSFWVLDDVTPLRQLSSEVASSDIHLYTPSVAYRGAWGGVRHTHENGQNPPDGAIIDYYLKAAASEGTEVRLEIIDSQGKTIREFSNHPIAGTLETEDGAEPLFPPLPTKAGMNRFVWDLRYDPIPQIPNHSAGDIYDPGLLGPKVVPGTYKVRLSVGKSSQEASFEMKLDPRMHVPQADLEKQLDLALKVHELLRQDYDTVTRLHNVHEQLELAHRILKTDPKYDVVLASGQDLNKKIDAIEAKLINPKITQPGMQDTLNWGIGLDGKLAILEIEIEYSDTAPAQTPYEMFQDLQRSLAPALAQAKDLLSNDVSAFNQLASKSGIGNIIVSTVSSH